MGVLYPKFLVFWKTISCQITSPAVKGDILRQEPEPPGIATKGEGEEKGIISRCGGARL